MTGREQSDPALERLAQHGGMSLLLTVKIIALIKDSGANQGEAYSALGAVRELMTSLGVPRTSEND